MLDDGIIDSDVTDAAILSMLDKLGPTRKQNRALMAVLLPVVQYQ